MRLRHLVLITLWILLSTCIIILAGCSSDYRKPGNQVDPELRAEVIMYLYKQYRREQFRKQFIEIDEKFIEELRKKG